MRYAAVMAACGSLVAGCSRGANTPEKAGIAATYDTKTGKLTELAYDSNHNGKVDTWTEMNGTHPVRTRIDRNEDGKIDRWEYYDDHSNLVKVGLSRADTGKPDTWVFAGGDGKTRRIEISSAADETKIDRWEHYAGEAMPPPKRIRTTTAASTSGRPTTPARSRPRRLTKTATASPIAGCRMSKALWSPSTAIRTTQEYFESTSSFDR